MFLKCIQRKITTGFILVLVGMVACAFGDEGQMYRYISSQPPMTWAFSVTKGAEECVITMNSPSYELVTSGDGVSINVPGVSAWTNPGEPRLPVFAAVFELEEGVRYIVNVETGVVVETKAGSLEPTPKVSTISESDNVYQVVNEKQPDAKIYGMSEYWPGSYYSIDEAKGAGRRYLRVGIFSFQYNPSTQMLKQYLDLKVKLKFTGPDKGES